MAALLRVSHIRQLARLTPSFTRLAFTRHFTSYPADRKYRPSHEWAKIEGDVATIGITDHAQAALGDIVHADLPEVGSEAGPGEAAATISSVKATADIFTPIGGEIVGINGKLEDEPDLINVGPHEEGWMFKVKFSDPAQIEGLMSSAEYEDTLKEEK